MTDDNERTQRVVLTAANDLAEPAAVPRADAVVPSKTRKRRGFGITEGFILRGIFYGLLTATLTVLALDYRELDQAAATNAGPFVEPLEPVEMAPPRKNDQRRPYLLRTIPVTKERGRLAVPGFEDPPKSADLDSRMQFRLGSDGEASAVGRIDRGTAEDLDRFLAKNKSRIVSLTLHSPGGSVPDAIEMARAIRKARIDTVVADNGYCASSCPLVFAGGLRRTAGLPAWIGVHQVFTERSAVGTLQEGLQQGQEIGARCQELLVEMGVDARVWVHAMATSSDELYVFTPEELAELKLVTLGDIAPAEKSVGVEKIKGKAKSKGSNG